MKPFLIALLLVAAAPGGARATSHKILTVVSDDNYPPYIFRDAEGRLKGILPDQWALWEQKTGVKVRLHAMDWEAAKAYMQNGHADVIDTFFRTPEREQLYNFTPPYAQIKVPVYAREGLGGIADITSLKGFTVGVKAGDAVIDQLRAGGVDSLKEYPNYESIVQAAGRDELKVFSVDEPAALYYLYKYDIADRFRESFVLYTGEFHRAVQKDQAGTLQLVEAGFGKITPREYRAIEQKWLGRPFLLKQTLREWLPELFLVAGVLSVLVAVNLFLRRQVRARTLELSRALAELQQSFAQGRKTEAELRQSRELVATVLESANDGICIQDCTTGRLVFVNQRMLDLYGFATREAALAADFSELSGNAPPYSLAEAQEWMRKTRTQGPQIFEWRARRQDGRLFWVEVSIRQVWIGPDERLISTVRDIGERKTAEEEHRLFERRLQESQRLESLGLLAGGIAHDFNNLLAAILGNIELALMSIPDKSPAHEDIQAAITATKRAADLVQQMLAYAGKGRFLVESIDVPALVRETVGLLNTSISKHARVNLNLPAGLLPIDADATQVRQVIMNLIINASESLGDIGGKIDVSAGTMDAAELTSGNIFPATPLAPGPYVYIEVADTGSGMPPDMLAKIFDPFYSTKFAGRGLGLPVVFGIVRSHKGAIRVESALGKGTVFRVLFPASTAAAAAPPPAAVAGPPTGWNGSGRLLLLVDDDPGVIETGVKLLERQGFQVLCAMDGRHAVNLFRAQSANIAGVILDLTMPNLDGAGALAELRRIRPDVPVIVSSGHGEQEVMQRFAGLEPDGFLQKPYTLEGLRTTLGHLLPG